MSEEDSVEKWLAVRQRLHKGIEELNEHARLVRWPFTREHRKEEAEQAWDKYEIFHSEDVVAALDRWLRGESLHDCSAESLGLLRFRFGPAFQFARQHLWQRGTRDFLEWKTFLPFPSASVDEVVRLLLTDWWTYHGSILEFDRMWDEMMHAE